MEIVKVDRKKNLGNTAIRQSFLLPTFFSYCMVKFIVGNFFKNSLLFFILLL